MTSTIEGIRRWWLLLLAAVITLARLCHVRVVWVEEAYPIAAALEMLRGKMLYRDIWFDKPPLFPAFYLLFGAQIGWPLRIAGAALILIACWLAWSLARSLWTEREGVLAAVLLGFFLTFGVPSAVMAAAPDLLMVAPHLAAILLCVRGRPFLSGLAGGVALLLNAKAAYVLAACLLWQWRAVPFLVAGVAAVQLPAMLWLWANGALAAYWQQVWQWGFLYGANPPFEKPWLEGLRRTANWAGFHATLIAGAMYCLVRGRNQREPSRIQLIGWVLLSFAAVCAGWRFFPRYYFQLLTPMCIIGARGAMLMNPRWRMAVLCLLLIPMARYGPRYAQVAMDQPWGDLALHDDSRAVAAKLRARQIGSLLVWGYRPDVYAYSRIPAATRFLDSQPLTGVIADRHLTDSQTVAPDLAKQNRLELLQTEPDAIVDGLGPLNPDLAIGRYDDLHQWFQKYILAERTAFSVIYIRRSLLN